MALLALLIVLLALLSGSAGSDHGSAGSAQWLCWLCSMALLALLATLLTTYCHIASIKLRQLWRVTAHDNSLFLILTNRSLILSAANTSNNRLTINQTPSLQTNFIRSKDNNNVSSTFLNEFWPTENFLPTGTKECFSYGTELTEWDEIQINCSQPAVEWTVKFWTGQHKPKASY